MRGTTALRPARPVAVRSVDVRAEFGRRTYVHLFGAIAAFTVVERLLFATRLHLPIAHTLLGTSWPAVLGGFVLVGWLASRVARAAASAATQHAALIACLLTELILFVPLLHVARYTGPGLIESAAVVTLLAFTSLSAVVWTTRRDFSFLGRLLAIAGVVALVLIAAGSLFGFEPGALFAVVMVALAGGAILHDTSKVVLQYSEHRRVGTALQLFTSVALIFWWVLRVFMARRG